MPLTTKVREGKENNMKIVLVKSDSLDGWYSIERAEHENRIWLERVGPNVSRFMYSGRISDACVEGTAFEMLEIAAAIKQRESLEFNRCAVRIEGDLAYFWSPRNSSEEGEVPLSDADEFANQVLLTLGTNMRIFLDDARQAPPGWIQAYWPEEVITLLETGNVTEISLDHDLGNDERGTGYDVVLWIEEAVATRGFIPPKIVVHSANSSARERMERGIANIERLVSQTKST